MIKKSITVFVIASLFLTFISNGQTPVPGGQVSGTWSAAGSPYLIQGDITVLEGEVLVIEPGSWIEFQGHYKLNVIGSLIAEGTATETIMFTINDSTGHHNINIPDGGWNGLRFGFVLPTSDSSRLKHCTIAFGKANGSSNQDKEGGGAGVHDYANLVIANSVFYHCSALENGGAVAMLNSNITLEDNEYWHCRANNGGAVAIFESSPVIRNSFFVDNHAQNSGGAISIFMNSNCEVTTNLFAGNFADYGGALQIQSNCNPTLTNCLIYSNVAYEEGGGADLEDNCQATFINNTIVGNFALFGGGIDVEVNSSPVFRNSILWGNTAFVDGPEVHLFSEDSDPDFYYCDLKGGVDSIGTWYGGSIYLTYEGTYENNIDADPDFYDLGDYKYLLNDGSPCIDAGDPQTIYNDLEDPNNPGQALWPSKGTLHNDMGVYGGPYALNLETVSAVEENQPFSTVSQVDQFICYPNPVGEMINISYRNNRSQHVLISITDLYGREITTLLNNNQVPGKYTYSALIDFVPNGIYFCIVKVGDYILTSKLVVLR